MSAPLPVPAVGLALLFGTDPADRALAGWSPSAFVQLEFGPFLRDYGLQLDARSGPGYRPSPGPLRWCARGHEQVLWAGASACWCCAPPDSPGESR